MKAMVYTRYGPPEMLELREIETPVPGENEVLVRVRAASLNALDYRRFEKLSLMGRFMEAVVTRKINKVLGADFAGIVEAVGAAVKDLRPGDEVFGGSPSCSGSFAEHACADQGTLALKPAGVSFEEAAATPVAALTALQGLRDKGKVRPGMNVLVNGASGGVGTFAVQIAKALGAQTTAVCSARNLDQARMFGADRVIDYQKEDFTEGDETYDLIFAVNGYHPLSAYRRVLRPGGVYLCAGGEMRQIFQAMLWGRFMSGRDARRMAFMGVSKTKRGDLECVAEMIASGKVSPVIDRRYPLAETVAAVRYVLEEHARGKVIITMD